MVDFNFDEKIGAAALFLSAIISFLIEPASIYPVALVALSAWTWFEKPYTSIAMILGLVLTLFMAFLIVILLFVGVSSGFMDAIGGALIGLSGGQGSTDPVELNPYLPYYIFILLINSVVLIISIGVDFLEELF